MTKTAPQAVLVVGMHRSGTSALAGALSQVGVDFGQDLMPSNQTQENAKGFFEDLVTVRLHNLILGTLGSKWDDPRMEMGRWSDCPEVRTYRDLLKDRILTMFGGSDCWGVKDPRMCLLLPMWLEILSEVGITPVCVPVIRHPLEVASSLQKRNHFSINKGLHLWVRYHHALGHHLPASTVRATEYEDLLQAPAETVHRIITQAGLSTLPQTQAQVGETLGDFISPSLRHQRTQTGSTENASCMEKALEMYERIRSSGQIHQEDGETYLPDDEVVHEHLCKVESEYSQMHQKTIDLDERVYALEQIADPEKEFIGKRMGRLEWELSTAQKEIQRLRQALSESRDGEGKAGDRLEDQFQLDLQLLDEHQIIAVHTKDLLSYERKNARWLKDQWNRAQAELEEVTESPYYRATWPVRFVIQGIQQRLHGVALQGAGRTSALVRRLPPALWRGSLFPLLEGSLQLPPSPPSPLVSIVLPVYGQMEVTFRCLESLTRAKTSVSFEIIVVDDVSPDATPDLLETLKNLRFFRNEKNLGFVGTCNMGAAQARGEYLLFLNSDTEVGDEFLEHLLKVFEQRKDAGIVGGKLIYPNGLLMECGGIIWKDGRGTNFGNLTVPEGHDVSYVREVDYVSGACLLIPGSLFSELGGFGAEYAPGYYEDVDLAFRVREKGLKVFVQPACEVLHHEGVSAGVESDSSSMKHFTGKNRAVLLDHWKTVLERHPSHQDTSPAVAARHLYRRFILFIDSIFITPEKDSGSYRTDQMLRLMVEEGAHVTFTTMELEEDEEEVRRLQQAGVRVVYRQQHLSLKLFLEEEGGLFDVVILSRLRTCRAMLPWIRRFAPQANVVFDTVDLHFFREMRQAELSGEPHLLEAARQTKEDELGLIQKCDCTLVVSPAEQELLTAEVPDARVQLLPNIFDQNPTKEEFNTRSGMLFIGNFDHPPNVDAMLYFLKEVMPLIREQPGETVLTIVGPNPPEVLLELVQDDVRILGWVQDVRPLFESCRVCIAPLRFGAGVKGKINMSLAWGVPVVGTSLACEGMHLEDEESVLVADTPEAFAAAVRRACTDPDLWETLREGGLLKMERHFSSASVRPWIQELVHHGLK